MANRGRPRLTPEDLEIRLADYCRRYRVSVTPEGLPPFPSGQRETAQHREWLVVYKAHRRLSRRARGRCESCEAPAADGSIFCIEHRTQQPRSTGPAAGSAAHHSPTGAPPAPAGSECPICGRTTSADPRVRHATTTTGRRAAFHASCLRLVRLAERAGREPVQRVVAWLWPELSTDPGT
jgi:hypothetical protein